MRWSMMVVVAMATGFGMAAPGSARAQGPRVVTVAAGSSTLVGSGVRMARELGLFEKRGIDVRITALETASAAMTALIAGSVDFATTGPAELVVAQTRGQKLVALTSIYHGLGASLLLSKALADGSGLTAASPVAERLRALNNVVIAAPSPTATYKVAFDGAAKAAGATVRFTYMAQGAMPAALESGAVAGYLASAPVWTASVLRNAAVLWITGPKGEVPAEFSPVNSVLLLTTRRLAEAEPALMNAVSGALADLASAVAERPSDVKAAIRRMFPDLDDRSTELLFASEAPAWRPPALRADDMKREIAFLKATGMPLPNVDALDPASIILP